MLYNEFHHRFRNLEVVKNMLLSRRLRSGRDNLAPLVLTDRYSDKTSCTAMRLSQSLHEVRRSSIWPSGSPSCWMPGSQHVEDNQAPCPVASLGQGLPYVAGRTNGGTSKTSVRH